MNTTTQSSLARSVTAVAALFVALAVGYFAAQAQATGDTPTEKPVAKEEAKPYTPRTFEPSFLDRATALWEKREYADAIYWYRRWLEANPKDNHTWYNLACTYAVNGQPEKAIEALETSIDAGWNEPDTTANDKDFDSIRALPRFAAALERCKAAASGGKARENTVRRLVDMKSYGTYLAYLPADYETAKDKTYPMCLILHGAGSSETGHGDRMSEWLGRDGVVYIAPRAPYGDFQSAAATGRDGFNARHGIESANPQVLHNMEVYVNWIDACAQDAKQAFRVDPKRVFAIGHSQGGGAALALAAAHDGYKAVCSYAGFDTPEVITEARLEGMKKRGSTATIVHCIPDAIVPVDKSRAAEARMKAAGVPVSGVYYEKGTHGFSEEVRSFCKEWMNKVVREFKW